MTWEIVVGIIALVGFIGSIAAYVAKLSRTLAMLETTLKVLNETLKDMKANSKTTHKELFKKIDEHEKILNHHGERLLLLEERRHDNTNH